MCIIQICEACIYKDQASPCPMSQNNPKCIFYIKPKDRVKSVEDKPKKDDKIYDKGNLPL